MHHVRLSRQGRPWSSPGCTAPREAHHSARPPTAPRLFPYISLQPYRIDRNRANNRQRAPSLASSGRSNSAYEKRHTGSFFSKNGVSCTPTSTSGKLRPLAQTPRKAICFKNPRTAARETSLDTERSWPMKSVFTLTHVKIRETRGLGGHRRHMPSATGLVQRRLTSSNYKRIPPLDLFPFRTQRPR